MFYNINIYKYNYYETVMEIIKKKNEIWKFKRYESKVKKIHKKAENHWIVYDFLPFSRISFIRHPIKVYLKWNKFLSAFYFIIFFLVLFLGFFVTIYTFNLTEINNDF